MPKCSLRRHRVRLCARGERQHAVDDRLRAAALDRGAEALEQAAHDLGLLPVLARAQRGADQLQALGEHGADVELRLGAAHQADPDQPAAHAQTLEVRARYGGADRVEHDVDAFAARALEQDRRELAARGS